MTNYETIIGIEVHAELNTKHKIFSPSINDINAEPNTNIHPIDLGLPGTLPRFNEEVLQKAIVIAKGFNMEITKEMHWDRKNYFYPDNPKGFQITQQETPIGRHGYIELDNGKKIAIDFMHMEEDTAKSFHRENKTLLDFNRCGVPLVEIVSGPDMRSGKEAREYLEKLREILLFLDASDCKMEEGSLRVDVNISVRPYGQEEFNTKVEVKNLNSFANVEMAIEEEVKNQTKAYNTNKRVVQCTKRFNEATKTVDLMRVKESQDDYRYFPEPDLPWIRLTDDYIDSCLADMPKLPKQIKAELIDNLKLDQKSVSILMMNREMTLFFLEAIKVNDPKQMLNYLTVNVNEYMNKAKVDFKELNVTVQHFTDMIELLNKGNISSNHVKKLLPEILKTGEAVNVLTKKLGLEQITDEATICGFVTTVLDANPDSIELFKGGKDRAFGFLVGQVMKQSKGQANPQLVNSILKSELEKR